MEAYISQVMIWPPNFAPRSWAYCDGGLMAISSNTALFSLIGTMYGGDGRTTFGRPDLRGRVPIGAGRGPGLSNYTQGQIAGVETVTLTQLEMPVHNHQATFQPSGGSATLNAFSGGANETAPGPDRVLASTQTFGQDPVRVYSTSAPNTTLGGVTGGGAGGSVSIGNSGGGQAHYNMQPFQVLNYVICLEGIFPPRN